MTADTCAIIGTVDSHATPSRSNRGNAEKRQRALDALRSGSSVSEAAKAAGVARETLWKWRQRDEEFAVAYHDAAEEGTDRCEDEALRRAVDGWDEPVWHQGVQVGVVRKYDSTLLIFLLKARRPDKYRDNVKVEHTVNGPTDAQLERARRAGMDEAIEARAAEFLGMLEGAA